MSTVTMVEFRKHAEAFIRRVSKGHTLLLTYRGRPMARLVPPEQGPPPAADPFYRLPELADPKGTSLTNREIDRILYGA